MSIYIPNMDMPTKAKDEVITIYPDGTVLKYSLDSDFHNAKSRAIEVPPHGALKDADALLGVDRHIYRSEGAAIGIIPYISIDEIDEADTIIPASKEGAE